MLVDGFVRTALLKVDRDLQTVAEIIFLGEYYRPQVERSETDFSIPSGLYSKILKKPFYKIEKILRDNYEKKYTFPENYGELVKLTESGGVRIQHLRDPWGQPFQYRFGINKSRFILAYQ